MALAECQLRSLRQLCRVFLATLFAVALLWTHLPVPAVLSGELLPGLVDQPPGVKALAPSSLLSPMRPTR
jgi:hypothetical protein